MESRTEESSLFLPQRSRGGNTNAPCACPDRSSQIRCGCERLRTCPRALRDPNRQSRLPGARLCPESVARIPGLGAHRPHHAIFHSKAETSSAKETKASGNAGFSTALESK